MKKRISLLAVLLVAMGQTVFAQTLEDGKNSVYDENYQTAEQTLQQVVSAKPSDAEAYYYLGLADLGLGKVDQAKADFQKGLQADPKSALNTVGLGRVAIEQKDYNGAKQYFQQAWTMTEGRDFDVVRAILKATATSIHADGQYALDLVKQFKENRRNRRYEMTAQDYTAIGDVYASQPNGGGNAATNYENAESANPKYARAYYREGELYHRAYNDTLALNLWNQAVTVDPKYKPAVYRLFWYYRFRDLDKAQKYLDQYASISDDQFYIRQLKAELEYSKRNYSAAVNQAKQILQDNPNPVTSLYKLLAISENQLGDSLDAKKYMDTYFSKTDPEKLYLPEDYEIYYGILQKLHMDSLANVYIAKAVNEDTSTDLNHIRNMADQERLANNFVGASLWYAKLLKLEGTQTNKADDYYHAFSLYGAALNGHGTFDSCEAAFKDFIKKYPNEPSGYFYLGQCQQAQDTSFRGLAVAAFQQYLNKLKKEDLKGKEAILTRIYSYIGGCYATQGNKDQAMAYADKIVALDPHNQIASNIYSNVAFGYAKAKDLANASKFAQKALDINASNGQAQQILAYVKSMQEYEAKMKKYNEAKKKQ